MRIAPIYQTKKGNNSMALRAEHELGEMAGLFVTQATDKAISHCIHFLSDLHGDSFATRDERKAILNDMSYARETLYHVYHLEVFSYLCGYLAATTQSQF